MAALWNNWHSQKLDPRLKLYLIRLIAEDRLSLLVTPYHDEQMVDYVGQPLRYRYTSSRIWQIDFDRIQLFPDELKELTTEEALLLAHLEGDRVAWMALVDKVIEGMR